ncbi:MAG TPA: hypothetical protein VH599_09310 [Ktedonobacterales bacterium]|jgi:dienelactone hydrolase
MAEGEQDFAAPVDAARVWEEGAVPEGAPATADAALASAQAAPKKPRRKRSWGMWPSRVALALLFLIGFFVSMTPDGRVLVRGALLLSSALTATQPGPLVEAGEPISHTQPVLPAQTGQIFLDVYVPVGKPPPIPGSREAVILITGVGDNRTDPQLLNLSESLARLGVVVVNMTTTQLLNVVIDPADKESVIQVFNYAAHLPGVNPRDIGIVGFSGGAALACLAAADPRLQDRLAFIATFGAFYNAADLLRDFGRRSVTADGVVTPFHPGALPIQALANMVGGTLPPDEGQLFINGLTPGGTPLADPDTQLTTPGAAAAYHLIAGDEPDPAQVERNMAALSPAVKQLFDELSPSEVIAQIRCPIYLLHDHADPYVPFTESRNFDAALTRLGHPHEYAEFGIFHHTEISSGFGLGPLLGDGSKLYRILDGVLSASA